MTMNLPSGSFQIPSTNKYLSIRVVILFFIKKHVERLLVYSRLGELDLRNEKQYLWNLKGYHDKREGHFTGQINPNQLVIGNSQERRSI